MSPYSYNDVGMYIRSTAIIDSRLKASNNTGLSLKNKQAVTVIHITGIH